MVYIAGIVGFIAGFLAGQKLLLYILRDYSNEELMQDKSLRWKFGTLNWALAIFGAVLATWIYNSFFLPVSL